MAITIVGPKGVTLPASLGGDDTVFGLVLVATTRGLFVDTLPDGRVQVAGITDYTLLTLSILQLLLSKDCEVHGYQAFFELTAEQLGEEVPENFPNRTYTVGMGEEAVTHVHTWETWGDPAREIAGKTYKSNQDRANLGQPLPASLWVKAGLVTLPPAELLALTPQPEAPAQA